ncbi:hypothetical protein Tco_0731495 [Tanacetum coccineum]
MIPDEVIKSSVEILVPTPSESEGVPKVCDLPFHDNSSPLEAHRSIKYFCCSQTMITSVMNDSSLLTTSIMLIHQPPDVEDLFHLPIGETIIIEEDFADDSLTSCLFPNLECFKFKIEPDPGDLTSIDPGFDFPDCEDSRFCPSLELHILSFILGIRYPNLID